MILLLDIDGVLETSPAWKKPEFLEDNFYKFNETARQNLIEIMDKTHPEIILTTTHRINYNLMQWKQIFALRGIQVDSISKINNATKVTDLKQRNLEIEAWFLKNRTAEFLIVDDDKSLHELSDHLKNRWIQIDAMLGITEAIKKRILEKIHHDHDWVSIEKNELKDED